MVYTVHPALDNYKVRLGKKLGGYQCSSGITETGCLSLNNRLSYYDYSYGYQTFTNERKLKTSWWIAKTCMGIMKYIFDRYT